jgi:hypothetical protein
MMLRLLAGHDLSHLAQIARYIEAAQQQATRKQFTWLSRR